MELYRGFLTGNLILDLAISAWFAAQLIKVLIELAIRRKSSLSALISSGGMPSSHSAFVCALAVSMGILYGWRSQMFALAAGLAAVVMYDAFNVRWSTGEQAKALNRLLASLDEPPEDLKGRKLKEALGHTPFQVLMGAFLGVLIGMLALLWT